jgi:protein-S-isoprenylcysteine O-methyltransferase Ste14
MTRAQIGALLKTAVFTVVVPGLVAVYAPYRILKGFPPLQNGLLTWLGGVIIVFGALVYLRCAWDFAVAGRGTPAIFDPPRNLVVRGMHRYVRNPMYVGVLSLIAGEAMLFHAKSLAIYAGLVWIFFHLFVLLYEEPTLERKFGDSYLKYKGSVGRWLPRW